MSSVQPPVGTMPSDSRKPTDRRNIVGVTKNTSRKTAGTAMSSDGTKVARTRRTVHRSGAHDLLPFHRPLAALGGDHLAVGEVDAVHLLLGDDLRLGERLGPVGDVGPPGLEK